MLRWYKTCQINLEHITGTRAGITMYPPLFGITLLIYTCCVTGFPGFDSENCVTNDAGNCSQYKVCTEDEDHQLYPGRTKTIPLNLYIPRGLTQNGSIRLVTTFPKKVVILSDAYLTFRDTGLTVTNEEYHPDMNAYRYQQSIYSTQATFNFGDMDCKGIREFETTSPEPPVTKESSTMPSNRPTPDNGSSTTSTTGEPCQYCLVQLAVEYLMADIAGVPDNSTKTVSASFISDNGTVDVVTTLVLRLVHNSTKKPTITTDIPDMVEMPIGRVKRFKLQTIFPNPLSKYTLTLVSSDIRLWIASVAISAVGDNYKEIVQITKSPRSEDEMHCNALQNSRIMAFGYLPNTGAYNSNTSTAADTVDLDVILVMKHKATPGDLFTLDINLEVDNVEIKKISKYFNASERIQMNKLTVQQNQTSSELQNGRGDVVLTLEIPPFTSALYKIETSTRRYGGSVGDELQVAAMGFDNPGTNVPCISLKTSYLMASNATAVEITNIPYSPGAMSNENTIDLKVVVVRPGPLVALSSHELTIHLNYPFVESPQVFKFYFNESNEEKYARLESVYMEMQCESLTSSTEMRIALETSTLQEYGRVFVEIPAPSVSTTPSFKICNVKVVVPENVAAFYNLIETRDSDGMIEKAIVDFSSLINFGLIPNSPGTDVVSIYIIASFADTFLYLNNTPASFTARVVSSEGPPYVFNQPFSKPAIEFYPDFLVLFELELLQYSRHTFYFHYSLNGSYFYRMEFMNLDVYLDVTKIYMSSVVDEADDTYSSGTPGLILLYFNEGLHWNNSKYLERRPKIIGYFYWSTVPCGLLCSVSAKWETLSSFVTLANDHNNTLLRKLPVALDQSLDTCFVLPVPGDSPPLFWLRITHPIIFKVFSNRFAVRITGEGIKCERKAQGCIQVGTSGPLDTDQCSMESDMVFCKLMSEKTNGTLTQYNMECKCETILHCRNVHIVIHNNKKDIGRLCEIDINYV